MIRNVKDKEVLIIIPAYNERGNIEGLLDKLCQWQIASIADILVMNDASTDGTNWIAKEKSVAIVTHVFNLGYGSGLQLGYKYAIRRGYKYVIQLDADGQHDVNNVLNIYQQLTTADENGKYPDIVLGSRFLDGSVTYKMSFVRKCAIRLFRGMIKAATGERILDPTTGLQGLSRRVVLYYSKYNNFDDRYPDANMITQMLLLGYRIKEIPAIMHPREDGVSMHSGLKPIIYMFRMFFSIIAVLVRIKLLKIETGIVDDKK